MPDDLEADLAGAELAGDGVDTIRSIGNWKGAHTIGARDGNDAFVILDPDGRFLRAAGAGTSGKLVDEFQNLLE